MALAAFFELQKSRLFQCGQVAALAIQLLPHVCRTGAAARTVQALIEHQPGFRILLGTALAQLLTGKVGVVP
ncbi:hypothetical protein D3C77_307850 [compost metagenome]